MLPTDKGDTAAVHRLSKMDRETLVPLVPMLLEWLQDMNWPVAGPVAMILRDYPHEFEEPVRAVLQGQDDVWKYWVVSKLLVDGPPQLRSALSDEIFRIVNAPTLGEQAEKVDLVARDVVFALSYVDE